METVAAVLCVVLRTEALFATRIFQTKRDIGTVAKLKTAESTGVFYLKLLH